MLGGTEVASLEVHTFALSRLIAPLANLKLYAYCMHITTLCSDSSKHILVTSFMCVFYFQLNLHSNNYE